MDNLGSTTSGFYEQPKRIDFTVMGLDTITSDFLNWCLMQRDNLEFLKDSNFMNSKSMMVASHFNDLKIIMKIEKPEVRERA